jgi:hypothetical protein
MVTLRSVISKYHLYMYITQVGESVLNSYEKKRRQEGSYTGGRKEGRKEGREERPPFLYLYLVLLSQTTPHCSKIFTTHCILYKMHYDLSGMKIDQEGREEKGRIVSCPVSLRLTNHAMRCQISYLAICFFCLPTHTPTPIRGADPSRPRARLTPGLTPSVLWVRSLSRQHYLFSTTPSLRL